MSFEEPKHSRSSVDKAGRSLLLEGISESQLEHAYDVVSNWRSSHALPLNTMQMDLRQKVKRISANTIVVQRLKRTRSILGKLSREPSMRLTQMQDIGGCRVVVNSIKDVYKIRDAYFRSKSKHQFVEENDYVKDPKTSGYRSLHLVYKFRSDAKPKYNNLLIEIQIRTRIQHAWATAVETVGAVLGQSLKSSEGEQAWLEFFRNAAAAMAIIEGQRFIPGYTASNIAIAKALSAQLVELDVKRKLSAYRDALKETASAKVKNAAYFVLILRPDERTLQVIPFTKKNLESAYKEYREYEMRLPMLAKKGQMSLFAELEDTSGAQVVLIGAESLKSIRESYPNYYLDMDEFLKSIEGFIKKYGRLPPSHSLKAKRL